MKRLILFLGIAQLVACRREEPAKVEVAPAKSAPTVLDSMVAEFSHGASLVTRSNEGDMVLTTRRVASWVALPGDSMEFAGASPRDSIQSTLILDTALVPGDQILLFSSIPEGFTCQGCPAKAGAIFKSSGKWNLARNLGDFGDNGRMSRPGTIIRLPDGRTLLAMESSQIGQGEFQAALELLLLSPDGKHLSSTVLTSSDNAGNCDSTRGDCWGHRDAVDWSLSNLPAKLSLKRQGTALEEDGTFRKVEDTTFALEWKPAR